MTGHHGERIVQRMQVRAAPERVFEIVSQPDQVSQFASRIEGAQVLEPGPDGGLTGSRIELITSGGNTLMATVKRLDPPREVVWEDENGLKSTWRIEPTAEGCTMTNIMEGSLTGDQARKLAYDTDLKMQELARSLEAPGEDRHEGEGFSDIVGTPEGPRKGG